MFTRSKFIFLYEDSLMRQRLNLSGNKLVQNGCCLFWRTKKIIFGYNFVALLNSEISAYIQMAITLLTTYYLQMFWRDMKLKLTLEILLLNEVGKVTWILLKTSSGLYNTKCQIAKITQTYTSKL